MDQRVEQRQGVMIILLEVRTDMSRSLPLTEAKKQAIVRCLQTSRLSCNEDVTEC
jgi:hypothetical protein